MTILRLCWSNIQIIAKSPRFPIVFYRPLTPIRFRSTSPDSGVKDTSPSSTKPSLPRIGDRKADEGHLSFTKSSLYKLTLPLAPTSSNGKTPPASEADSDSSKRYDDSLPTSENETWEERIEKGQEPFIKQDSNDGTKPEGPLSVVFLLHSGQPLSYISNLISAEVPAGDADSVEKNHNKSKAKRNIDRSGDPTIAFYTSLSSNRRWSPSTGIGDFLREAARVGSFTISVGSRNIRVSVPSFEERTRFLRSALHEKTRRIERLAEVKDECDRIARRAAQRYAFAGAGVMTSWWITVGLLTFKTDLGWDVMEPITYLTGFGMVIGGYLSFLWHNREVSYRSLLTETTSRRQHKLYSERGFDVEAYQELIAEAKGLRRAIKRIAWDYELEWNQGDTVAGRSVQRALEVIRKAEELDRKKKSREEEEEREDDEALTQVDNDGDGQPDRPPRRT